MCVCVFELTARQNILLPEPDNFFLIESDSTAAAAASVVVQC